VSLTPRIPTIIAAFGRQTPRRSRTASNTKPARTSPSQPLRRDFVRDAARGPPKQRVDRDCLRCARLKITKTPVVAAGGERLQFRLNGGNSNGVIK